MSTPNDSIPQPTLVPEPHDIPPDYARSMVKPGKSTGPSPHPIWPYFVALQKEEDDRTFAYCKFCGTVHTAIPLWMSKHAHECIPMRQHFSTIPGALAKFDRWYEEGEKKPQDEHSSGSFSSLQSHMSGLLSPDIMKISEFVLKMITAKTEVKFSERSADQFLDKCCRYAAMPPESRPGIDEIRGSILQLQLSLKDDIGLDGIHPVTISVGSWTDAVETVFAVCATQKGSEQLLGMFPLDHDNVSAEKILEIIDTAFGLLSREVQQKVVAVVSETAPKVVDACQQFAEKHSKIAALPCVIHGMNDVFLSLVDGPVFKKTYTEITQYVEMYTEGFDATLSQDLKKLGSFSRLPLSPGVKFVRCCEDMVNHQESLVPFVEKWCSQQKDLPDSEEATESPAKRQKRPSDVVAALNSDPDFWERAKEFLPIIRPLYNFVVSMQSSDRRLSDAFVEYAWAVNVSAGNIYHSKHFKKSIKEACHPFTVGFAQFSNDETLLALFLDLNYWGVDFSEEYQAKLDAALSKAVYSGDNERVRKSRLNAFQSIKDCRMDYVIGSPSSGFPRSKPPSFVQKIADRYTGIVPHTMACDRKMSGFVLLTDENRGRISSEKMTLRAKCLACAEDHMRELSEQNAEVLHQVNHPVESSSHSDEENEFDQLEEEMCERLMLVEDGVMLEADAATDSLEFPKIRFQRVKKMFSQYRIPFISTPQYEEDEMENRMMMDAYRREVV